MRHYPYRFGLRMLRILPDLRSGSGCSFPDMPKDFDPLEEFFSQDAEDAWEDAGVPEVLDYLRGNKSLKIPREWREQFGV